VSVSLAPKSGERNLACKKASRSHVHRGANLVHQKLGDVMQTNCAPKILSATHGETGRYDRLDVSLLVSVINGDEAALRVLFTRHNVRIYRFVLRLTGNRSIAEEIISDVFL